MLEETESDQLDEKQKRLDENEQLRLTTASFVENLDKHQLFETLFANDITSSITDTNGLYMGDTTGMYIE